MKSGEREKSATYYKSEIKSFWTCSKCWRLSYIKHVITIIIFDITKYNKLKWDKKRK